MDGVITKAPLGEKGTGPNPTDRAKSGTGQPNSLTYWLTTFISIIPNIIGTFLTKIHTKCLISGFIYFSASISSCYRERILVVQYSSVIEEEEEYL